MKPVDEYQVEIDAIRRTLARLEEAQADSAVIAECEAELRNLRAIYAAAVQTFEAGRADPRLEASLAELGFGDWSLDNVYAFVYEAAVEADLEGHDLASVVGVTDYAASLLAVAAPSPSGSSS